MNMDLDVAYTKAQNGVRQVENKEVDGLEEPLETDGEK